MAKHFGSIMDFTRQRNDDLMRAFRHQLDLSRSVVMPDIFQKVADSPASRFWVSEERAAVEIARMLAGRPFARMLAGRPFARMRPNKREMFQEIFRRYLALREARPDLSLMELVSVIVHQPAPKFYLTARTVGEFIYRIKNGWYDKQFDRYRLDIDGK